jgi:hypothetical protein
MLHDEGSYPDPFSFNPGRFMGPSPNPDPEEAFGFGRYAALYSVMHETIHQLHIQTYLSRKILCDGDAFRPYLYDASQYQDRESRWFGWTCRGTICRVHF